MEQVVTILFSIFGIACGILLAAIKDEGNKDGRSWLGTIIGILSLILLFMHVITYYADWQNPYYNLLSLLFYVLLISVPPTVYIYLRRVSWLTKTDQHKVIEQFRHFLPSAVLLVINVFGFMVIVNGNPTSVFYQNIEQIVFFVNFTIITFFFILQNIYYLFQLFTFWLRARRIKVPNSTQVTRWIGFYLLAYTLFLFTVYFQQISFKAHTGWSLSAIFLTYFLFLSWHRYRQPKIALGQFRELSLQSKKKRQDDDPLIDEALVKKIQKKLNTAFEEQKIYLQSDLSLSNLAKELDTNDKYLRYVIGKLHANGFVSFVNQYRVEDAKAMLSDPAFSIYTVESIGQMAGFKSKSSFYAAFKEMTDKTPHRYRQHNKEKE